MEGQGHLLGKNYAFWLKEGQKLGKKEMKRFCFLWLLFTPEASSKYGHWHMPVL